MIEPKPMDDQSEANKAEPSSSPAASAAVAAETEAEANMRRKDKRKAMKKDKRKQKRKELAEKQRQEEEARLNDPEEQRRIEMEEEREKERLERERREFEERERLFLEELARRKALEEEEEEARKRAEDEATFKQKQVGRENEVNEEDDWEYVEEGPPEIIWQGNEIIVKKNKVRVKKKDADQRAAREDLNRPTSNPLPPQSEIFAEYKSASVVSAQQLLDDVAQQTPNFGTEQDKAHCPFHLKTGACRFGSRCSRVHFYPDKSCTLLIKNMYNGPGLAWEQDEGLEHTDEEIDRSYEEFYEDVHTEFLKFGEIVNFKVSRNSSVHLRGNVYVHFKSVDSAVLAYNSINGRYFAGKQVTCEFINVTRWRVAICGEYMKSKLKTCSRGTTCNFIHCFRNPGGDYEWADWDKPPPRYWIKKMTSLFGNSDEYSNGKQVERESSIQLRDARKMFSADHDRYRSRRSQSKEMESRGSRSHYEEHEVRRSAHQQKHSSECRKHRDYRHETRCEEETSPRDYHNGKDRFHESEADRDWSDRDADDDRHHDGNRRRSRTPRVKNEFRDHHGDTDKDGHSGHSRKRSKLQDKVSGNSDNGKDTKSKGRHRETSRERSSKDSDKNSHLSDRRRTLRHHDEVRISLDDHWDGKSRTQDSNYTGGWSKDVTDSCYTNDSVAHASEVSDDETTSNVKYSRRYKYSRGRDHSSEESSEDDMHKEHLRYVEKHGKRKSSGHESGEDGCERNLHQYQEGEDSHNTKYHFNENVAKSDRWETDKVVTEKHRKHRRKSDINE